MSKRNSITAIILAMAAVMSAFILLKTSPTVAKNVSRITKTEYARVAKWDFTVTDPTLKSGSVVAGKDEPGCYTFDVVSSSETSAKYSIRITGVPEGMSVKLDGSDWISSTGGPVDFETALMKIGPGQSKPHTLYLKADDSVESRLYDIGASVVVTQID